MSFNPRMVRSFSKSPCRICPNRIVGCHADCDTYKYWRASYYSEKEKIRSEISKEHQYVKYLSDKENRKKQYLRRRGINA